MDLRGMSMRQLRNRLAEAREQYEKTKSKADEKRVRRLEEEIEYREEKD